MRTSGERESAGEVPRRDGLTSGECMVKVRWRVAESSATNLGEAMALICAGDIGLCAS